MAQRALRKDAGTAKSPMHNYFFRDFGGINTQAKRQAIGPDEFSWIENVMPIGHGNAVIVPGRSTSLAQVEDGVCYYMQGYNLAGLNYMFMATDAGHLYQILLDSPYTRVEIGTGFSTTGIRICQWKNERIMIADPLHGLYTWDGSVLFAPGSLVSATVTAGGSYTVLPTWTVTGGGGAGGAVSSVMCLAGSQTITNAGTGYVVGDVITLVGGTFDTPGKLKVLTIGGGGSIASVSILDPGSYTVLGAAPLATTGGAGASATITPLYTVLSLNVTNSGTVPYSSAPVLTPSAGAATATANLSGVPKRAEHVASFSGRVWVSFNRTISYSAPDSYYDFSATAAGAIILTDETLHSNITQLYAVNQFLYVIGIDSVNTIGDVSVNANGDTVFSNVNLTASVGTDHDITVMSYYRSVFFCNMSGIYAVAGATPTKISGPLDGITRLVDWLLPPSSGLVMLEGILCSAFLLKYDDPVQGIKRPIIVVFFNNKWFVTSQGNDLTLISGEENGGLQNLYGSDGTNLYQLFQNATGLVPWKMQGAYLDQKDASVTKEVNAFGFEMDIGQVNGTVTFTLDVLQNDAPYYDTQAFDINVTGYATWINNAGNIATWQNNALATIPWLVNSYFMQMQDTSINGGTIFGKYFGCTMQSSDVTGSISSMMARYIYREQW